MLMLKPNLCVTQSSNSFGDQILNYHYDGNEKCYPNQLELSFPEGLWTEFTRDNMISLWDVNNWTY